MGKKKLDYHFFIVCPDIFMQHIWASFNKNTSTYEISEIEINVRENVIHTLSFLSRNKSDF